MKQTTQAATDQSSLLEARKRLRRGGAIQVIGGIFLAYLVLKGIISLGQIMAAMERILHIPLLYQWGNLLVMGILLVLLLCAGMIVWMGWTQQRISRLPLVTGGGAAYR